MNWGTKITVGMIIFMSFIFTLSFRMIKSDTELVTSNYYNKSVAYDEKAQQKSNYARLENKPVITTDAAHIGIQFPDGGSGVAILYRPDNKAMDREHKFSVQPGESLNIPTGDLTRGHWKIILSWKQYGITYFSEQNIKL